MNGRDLTGMRFGRIFVIEHSHSANRSNFWKCKCDCGNEKLMRSVSLVNHGTKSCGCIHKEQLSALRSKHNMSMTGNAEYWAWCSIKKRCYSTKHPYYEDYGGRGITVCERWRNNFELFLEDMGNRPSKRHSIDRIDVNGNYEPSNCRWANPYEQAINRRMKSTNKSGVTGVSFSNDKKKWVATISSNGNKVYLGSFSSFDDAVKVRKEAEIKYWGKSS